MSSALEECARAVPDPTMGVRQRRIDDWPAAKPARPAAISEPVMKIGVIYPQTELRGDPEAVRRIGLAAEELGYHHLLTYDHVLGATHDREPKLTGPYTEQHPFHDP